MGNSGRGQRQPYRALTITPPNEHLPKGRIFSASSANLSAIDHQAQENARHGGTCEVLWVHENGTFYRLFVYTPDNVAAFGEDAERVGLYRNEDIIRWYRKHHGAPELLEGITARNLRTKKRPTPTGTPTDNVVPLQYPQDDETDAPPLDGFRRPPATEETTMPEQDQAQPTPTSTPRKIELHFDVTGFPVVEAKDFKPVIAQIMEVTLYTRKDGSRYVGRIQLRGTQAKKDGTPANAPGNLWFDPGAPHRDDTPSWLLDFANEQCAPYLTPVPADDMTDGELFDSPVGHRLRHYMDKLLAAEGLRIEISAKRQWEAHVRAGVERARAIVSPLGDPSPINYGFDPDAVLRPDVDPWADWQSPEVAGLREAIEATDGTIPAVQEAAKAYIASLQGDERPAAEEPTQESPADVVKRSATPTDVAGALSFILTGHAASDRGPFAIHDADGFHDEPYVILPLDSMSKVLDEISQERW
ncbi:hypothetical protein [Streptomyces sp. MH60]|uniref:hypothetical protein n=1 Tax=Streptomyces sp. MH60 TaxID=1940758 RepID=UPI000CEDC593|nr:hypothetical protein [Streptomyces sp. MH60]PPS89578.1 hypothetical protein BZZ08_01725 [Streptomyces sp. MH60]